MKLEFWIEDPKYVEFIITDHWGTIVVAYPYPIPVSSDPPEAHPLVLAAWEGGA